MSWINLTLADGREVEVEFLIVHSGCPSNGWDEPGEAAEIEIERMTAEDDEEVSLDDDERARIDAEICARVEAGDFEDYDDSPGVFEDFR